MNGGKQPVHDGDYLLLQRLDSDHAGSITGTTMVIERQDISNDDQYLLRVVTKTPDGKYILKATNPDYPDFTANENMRTLAKLRTIIDPLDLAIGQNLYARTFLHYLVKHLVLETGTVVISCLMTNKRTFYW